MNTCLAELRVVFRSRTELRAVAGRAAGARRAVDSRPEPGAVGPNKASGKRFIDVGLQI